MTSNVSQFRNGQARWPLSGGDGRARLPGRFRHVAPLPNSPSLSARQKAGGFYFQSLLLYLSHAHFLFASLCPVGAPGHRRAGAADGATDFRADHLLLLCRLYSPVPDSGCPAMADIVEALLAM